MPSAASGLIQMPGWPFALTNCATAPLVKPARSSKVLPGAVLDRDAAAIEAHVRAGAVAAARRRPRRMVRRRREPGSANRTVTARTAATGRSTTSVKQTEIRVAGRSAAAGRHHDFDAVGPARGEIGEVVGVCRPATGRRRWSREFAPDSPAARNGNRLAALRRCTTARMLATVPTKPSGSGSRCGSGSPASATVLAIRRSLTKTLTTAFSPAPSGATMMSSSSR